MDLKDIKIGVLGGGVSPEREISLISARETHKALLRAGLDAVFVDISTRDREKIKELVDSCRINLAFIALHGEFGEDGGIQQILEELGVAYTGSKPEASSSAMDKILAKNIFIENKIYTPDFTICYANKSIPESIKYPVVVKPHSSGSSLGVSIVREQSALRFALDNAFAHQEKIILEDFIEGRELSVGILEDMPLGVVEIIPKKGYFDFNTKYTKGAAQFVCPAGLSRDVYRRVQSQAIAAHRSLGCRHFSRVDIRLSEDNRPYVLEVNSIPGLTANSLLPLSARAYNISFDELILKMVKLVLPISHPKSLSEVKS